MMQNFPLIQLERSILGELIKKDWRNERRMSQRNFNSVRRADR